MTNAMRTSPSCLGRQATLLTWAPARVQPLHTTWLLPLSVRYACDELCIGVGLVLSCQACPTGVNKGNRVHQLIKTLCSMEVL